jgi:hypothetical protein
VFLAGRTEWPRYREFIESGRKGLYNAVLTRGGTHAWSKRMGVKWVKRHGGSPAWTEEYVRERLGGFLEGRDVWPTDTEFIAAGEARLIRAVRRLGGAQRWADEFTLSRSRRSAKSLVSVGRAHKRAKSKARASGPRLTSMRWDEERIGDAIGPLIKELGRWPTKGEFHRAGLGSALSAVYDHGGSAFWQQRFGVSPKPFEGPLPDRKRWSEKRLESELRDFCGGRSEWPGYTEFLQAGASALYHAACSHGGIAMWRERLGFA